MNQAPASGPSRRTILLSAAVGGGCTLAAVAGLADAGVLPGHTMLLRALGKGGRAGSIPPVPPGPIRRGAFTSTSRRGLSTRWVIAYPPGADPARPRTAAGARLGVCLVLHGRGGSAEEMATIGYPAFLAAAVRAGMPPFALAAVDGGDTYWHRRRDGADSGLMVLTEFLPLLAAAGLAARESDRIALLGWSMGGYGSLLLASQLPAGRVWAIAAESPAVWRRYGDSPAGAFDDAADFRAYDVFARRDVLGPIPIRIDCGAADPLQPAVRAFAAGLHPSPQLDLGNGDHSWGYWRAKAAGAIAFIGSHQGNQPGRP